MLPATFPEARRRKNVAPDEGPCAVSTAGRLSCWGTMDLTERRRPAQRQARDGSLDVIVLRLAGPRGNDGPFARAGLFAVVVVLLTNGGATKSFTPVATSPNDWRATRLPQLTVCGVLEPTWYTPSDVRDIEEALPLMRLP
jgi:hypothetical protein